MRYGFKASAEQFGPRELLEISVHAEEVGLGTIAISDHFQPWRHNGGHAPGALPWLGATVERTRTATIGTSVLTPTLRYEPAVIAQAFATLACLAPGRVFLGIGTGEAMNETPATGRAFPGAKERRMRLAESITVMRKLWTEERVDFEGEYYTLSNATVYDRPDEIVPVYVAASGPLAAKLVGRVGDGFICTSGKDPQLYRDLLDNVAEGAAQAQRDPGHIKKMIEIKVSYHDDVEKAKEACHFWGALALSHEQKTGIEDPLEMERVADENLDKAHTRFIVSDDPDEVVEKIAPYVELGFTELVFHYPGFDQVEFLDRFAADVLPRMEARFGAQSPAGVGAGAR